MRGPSMNLTQFMHIMKALMPGKGSIPGVARELSLPYMVVRGAMRAAVEARLVEEHGTMHASSNVRGRLAKGWRLTYRGKRVVRAWFPRSGGLE